MWLRNPIAVEVSRTATTPIGFQLWDQLSNAPMDITGYVFYCYVARNDGGAFIASFDPEITSAVDGEFDIVFDGRIFANLDGSQETILLSYQIKGDDGSGDPVIVMRGPLIIAPGIK